MAYTLYAAFSYQHSSVPFWGGTALVRSCLAFLGIEEWKLNRWDEKQTILPKISWQKVTIGTENAEGGEREGGDETKRG